MSRNTCAKFHGCSGSTVSLNDFVPVSLDGATALRVVRASVQSWDVA